MRFVLLTLLIGICISGCTSNSGTTKAVDSSSGGARLTEDDKHRLYSAALAASESPLNSDLFKDVCRNIGIFGADGGPNDNYPPFVAAHIDWALRPEVQQFKREIDTREKAREYISKRLPQ